MGNAVVRGSRVFDPALNALKSASRAALYGSVDDDMRTGEFCDPAGNVFGIFQH